MKNKQEDFLKEIQETLADAEKAMEIQIKIDALPVYAIWDRKKLQEELKQIHLKQAQKAKERLGNMGIAISEIFKQFEEEEEFSEQETDKFKAIINSLTDRQARIALLACLDGKSFEEAIEIGQSYKGG